MAETITLEIRRPGRDPRHFDIEPGIYTVGSDNDCKICLNHASIGGRHAIITLRADACWLEDLGSAGGTLIDGAPVQGRAPVAAGSEIRLGPFVLVFHLPTADSHPPAVATPATPAAPAADAPPADAAPTLPYASPPRPSHPASGADDPNPEVARRRSIKQQIHRELVERLDIRRLTASRTNQDELREKARHTLEHIVNDIALKLPPGMDPAVIRKEVFDEALGLGPLEDLLADEDVTEIMVNGHDQIFVEKKGRLELTGLTFMDDTSVLAIIERIVSPIGRRIDESQPYVDARLPDGSRVNAIIHPLSLTGPCITIRKFSKTPFTDQDLIRFGTMTKTCTEFMRVCVMLRKNIIVSGGTGSGKTTLLNVLSDYLPPSDRIVTIEDAAELRLGQPHVVRLEARPPNIEGRGAVTIRDLVRNALRMRPDRIVVGECRGGEALDMLQAMNTGHDGSLTTVHSNSPRDVISRLETMVLMSGMDLPVRAIREQVAAAIDIIVHEQRFSDGSRKVLKVTEVMGLEGEQIVMQDIFEFNQTSVDEDGKVHGRFVPTGAVPTFLEDLATRGITIDRRMFDPRQPTGA